MNSILDALETLLKSATEQLDQSATHDGLNNCDLLAKTRGTIRTYKEGVKIPFAERMYLEYANEFLTADGFAEHHQFSREFALAIIKEGKRTNHERPERELAGYLEYHDRLLGKLRAEEAVDLTDEEIKRAFQGSVSETYCISAAIRLRDAGKLSLDDDWINN